MKFARAVFKGAAIYGIAVLAPQYFLEEKLGRDFPPPTNHPEHFYGFLGVALAFQVVFLIVAHDPVRFRPMMIPSILEKLAFGIAAPILVAMHRAAPALLIFGGIDLLLATLFAIAYFKTGAST